MCPLDRGRRRSERRLDASHHVVVRHGAGGRYHHLVGRVVALQVAADFRRCEAADALARAEDGPAEDLVGVGRALEMVEDDVVRRVLGRADSCRMTCCSRASSSSSKRESRRMSVRMSIASGTSFLHDARVVGGGSTLVDAFQLAADVLDLLGDLPGAAPARALEGHVLEEMCDAVLALGLVTRPGLDPDAERRAFQRRHGFGGDRQPVGKTRDLDAHAAAPRRTARLRSRMYAWSASRSLGRTSNRSPFVIRSAWLGGRGGSVPQAALTDAGNLAG